MVHLANSPNKEDNVEGIRNVCLLGPSRHGKTSIKDYLLKSANDGENLIKQEGAIQKKGPTFDAQFSSITFKPNATTSYEQTNETTSYEHTDELPVIVQNEIVCNIVDTPGHAELFHEVTAALRLVDGAILVIDPKMGFDNFLISKALQSAIIERVKPVLFINKIDELLSYGDQEFIYSVLKNIIDEANKIISTFSSSDYQMDDFKFCPVLGNVIFGSILHGWAFTLHDIAKYHTSKDDLHLPVEVLMKKLWGDCFYDSTNNTWSSYSYSESHNRGFNTYILTPLMKVYDAIENFKKEELIQLLVSMNIKTNKLSFPGKLNESLYEVMTSWLPASAVIHRAMIYHLPSPTMAQKFRIEALYEGSVHDEAYKAIENCDSNAPLMLQVTKVVPAREQGKFHAFGRVFCGKIHIGQTINIVSPGKMIEMKEEMFECKVHDLNLVHNENIKPVNEVTAGNICCISGSNNFIAKTATITTFKKGHSLKNLNFNTPLVIRRPVEPKNPSDLPKLNDGLKRLAKTDPIIEVQVEESGVRTVNAASELGAILFLKKLEEEYAQIQLKKDKSTTAYRETVTCESKKACEMLSPNKKNCMTMKAFPLPTKMVQDIENGSLVLAHNLDDKTAYLCEKYKFDSVNALNIWTFGPQSNNTNILVDLTKGAQNISDIREACSRGFQWCSQHGVLCEEPMRGMGFNICDVKLDTSASQVQRFGQIIPLTRQLIYASFLTGHPQLLEPVYKSEILCNSNSIEKLRHQILNARGTIVEEMDILKGAKVLVRANIPVDDSLSIQPGLFSYQREEVEPQFMFSHWQALPGNPMEAAPDNISYKIVSDIRYKKGLQEDIPSVSSYLNFELS